MTIGAKLLEVGEFAECLAALEAAIKPREVSPAQACLDERAPARGDRAALTPTELVVAWLEEAHRYGTLVAAVRSLLAEPTPVLPLGRLARAASNGARSRAKGETADERNEAIDTAATEKVFRFPLGPADHHRDMRTARPPTLARGLGTPTNGRERVLKRYSEPTPVFELRRPRRADGAVQTIGKDGLSD